MELTLVGGLVFALGLWLSVVSVQRLTQCIIFFSSFSGTAVINFGEYGMAPDVVFLGFLLLASCLSGRLLHGIRVSTNHLTVGLLIFIFLWVAILSSLFNWALHGYISLQVTQTTYLLFGILLTLVLSVELSSLKHLESGLVALRAAATFISLWGLFQAACFYTGITYPAFLFNNSKSHFADMYDQRAAEGIVRIASVATEPSFMASSLMIFGAFGATVIALDHSRRTKVWIIPLALTLVTVLLSTSSTGYIGILVLCCLLARRRPMLTLAGFGLAIVTASILLLSIPAAQDALYNMTIGKIYEGSYLERSTTFAPAIELFSKQPWFGFGWGADYSYSIVTLFLANLGVVGTTAFFAAIFGTLAGLRAARRLTTPTAQHLRCYAEAAENALLVYLAEGVASGFKYVVADFWCLWAFAIAIPSCLVCLNNESSILCSSVRTWPGKAVGVTSDASHRRA